MRSRRTGDEELMVEQVERLGARRLAEIVVNHCHRDERLHQTVRIALAASTPGGPLVKTLATEISSRRDQEDTGPYMLVDGHLRHAALSDLGNSDAPCLIADDDEAFTYNKRVNRLATIQEH